MNELRKKAVESETETRWKAVLRKDAQADGTFYYAVKTTGVFCRPSCASRPALRRNVAFFDSPGEAKTAGYRACKRCRPDELGEKDGHADAVALACRRIEESEEFPDLSTLATEAGLSRFHFHRVFKARTGLTPKAFALAARARRVRSALAKRGTVTESIYEAGFQSNSRFYEKANDLLGMRPASFRKGGAAETITFAVAQCSMGAILVAATGRGVCAISLGDDATKLVQELQDQFPRADFRGKDRDFEGMVARVIALVESPGTGKDLPLDIRGTAFQERVWQALREIPAGTTATYAEIAARIGAPRAIRAVGTACGSNTIAVAIPCHRVVRSDGSLSGYRWGIDRKRELLLREKAR